MQAYFLAARAIASLISRRASSASPAVGYLQLHNEQQKALTDAAFAPLTDNLVLPVQGLGRKKGKKNAR